MAKEEIFYLTKKGLEKIKEEYEFLKKNRLSMIKETPPILHSQDLNPEYLSFRQRLDFLEKRIIRLGYILKNFKLIKKPKKEKQNIVSLGASVTLEENGCPNEFTILGSLEANPNEGKISYKSPVGKTLLGKKIGDEVIINSPIRVIYKIKKIKYNCDCL